MIALIGRTLGQHRITERIGIGGMATAEAAGCRGHLYLANGYENDVLKTAISEIGGDEG